MKSSYAAKSPWVIHYDGSSCNGCDIEVLAALTPIYDAERFGVVNTGNPKHADIFVVTGGVNEQNATVIKQIYDQMLEPKVVVACGACACGGGVYQECYNVLGGTDTVIPVDAFVPGCAVRPESVLDAVLAGVKILEEKSKKLASSSKKKKPAGEQGVSSERGVRQEKAQAEPANKKAQAEKAQGKAQAEKAQEKAQAEKEAK